MAINNHEPNIDNTRMHHGWTRSNSKFPLFRGQAVSLHGQRPFMEISYVTS
jgi:hypothetical protein